MRALRNEMEGIDKMSSFTIEINCVTILRQFANCQ